MMQWRILQACNRGGSAACVVLMVQQATSIGGYAGQLNYGGAVVTLHDYHMSAFLSSY
jgi:hypothetical protein